MSIPTAPCPVRGCGRTDVPVDPRHAHRPHFCACDKRARLELGLSATKTWVLREKPYSLDERREHNLIIRALLDGQGDRAWRRGVADTAADPTSATMVDAFQASHAAGLDTAQVALRPQITAVLVALDAGDDAAALAALRGGILHDLRRSAERTMAAENAFIAASRAYERGRRTAVKTGLWREAARWWIEEDGVRLFFEFEAVWGEDEITLEVANGEEIERRAGMTVGAESWRSLVKLLLRLDAPHRGAEPDREHLVWRPVYDRLDLRPHIKTHYPLAVLALEALRRTLRLVEAAPTEEDGAILPEHVHDYLQVHGRAAVSAQDDARAAAGFVEGLRPVDGRGPRHRTPEGT